MSSLGSCDKGLCLNDLDGFSKSFDSFNHCDDLDCTQAKRLKLFRAQCDIAVLQAELVIHQRHELSP